MKFSASNDGQGLWEVIIALAIAGLVAIGLVRATSTSIKSSRFSADQSQVTALAQGKIAKIVDYKNKNAKAFWDNLNDFGSPNIVLAAGIVKEDSSSLSDTCFITAVNSNADWSGPTPTDPNAKMAKITVDVYWGSKNSAPDCVSGTGDYSYTLHFETNVTN